MPDDGTATLVQTVHDWADAIVSNDAARIATFIADEWVLVTPEVGIVTREAFLDAVSSGRLSHTTMSHEILRVAVHNSVGVVTTRGRNTGCFLGDPIEADEWTTDVFHYDNGRWRCSLTQLTPVTPRPEASP